MDFKFSQQTEPVHIKTMNKREIKFSILMADDADVYNGASCMN